METNVQASGPKFCIARAVVSMGLGIEGLIVALCAGIFPLCSLIFRYAATMADSSERVALSILTGVYGGIAIVFIIIAAVSAVVALVEANKFNALYNRPSRMAKAGKILSVITLVLCGLSLIAQLAVMLIR